MRMSYPAFRLLCDLVQPAFGDSVNCISGIHRSTEFKVGVCLYYLWNGTSYKVAADVGGIGESTVIEYVKAFCAVVTKCLKLIYMPGITS